MENPGRKTLRENVNINLDGARVWVLTFKLLETISKLVRVYGEMR